MGKRLISRIFVVDDEWLIASTLASILKMNGFDASFYTSPVRALELARLEAPDLLISDVVMPELNGVDLAMRFKALCVDCKVILFSGQGQTTDLLEKARREGYDLNLLTKPIHPERLLAHIRAIPG
jgi:DNA-binding response OmpR family regulator